MALNKLEKYLINTVEYLDGMGLDTFLSGSTLLQIIRDGNYRERHPLDREVNLGCRSEDFKKDMLDRIAADNSFFRKTDGYVIFGPQENNCWDGGYFTFLGFHTKDGNDRVEKMDTGYLFWPSKHVGVYDVIKYKDHDLNIPSEVESWLETYFGEDWGIENLKWNWSDANNFRYE